MNSHSHQPKHAHRSPQRCSAVARVAAVAAVAVEEKGAAGRVGEADDVETSAEHGAVRARCLLC